MNYSDVVSAVLYVFKNVMIFLVFSLNFAFPPGVHVSPLCHPYVTHADMYLVLLYPHDTDF